MVPFVGDTFIAKKDGSVQTITGVVSEPIGADWNQAWVVFAMDYIRPIPPTVDKDFPEDTGGNEYARHAIQYDYDAAIWRER